MCNLEENFINTDMTLLSNSSLKKYNFELWNFRLERILFYIDNIVYTLIVLAFLVQLLSFSNDSSLQGFKILIKTKLWIPLILDELIIFFLAVIIVTHPQKKIMLFGIVCLSCISFMINISMSKTLSLLIDNYSDIRIIGNFLIISLSVLSLGIKKHNIFLYFIFYILILSYSVFLFLNFNITYLI